MARKIPVLLVAAGEKVEMGPKKKLFLFLFHDMLCNITQQLIKKIDT